MKLLYANVEKIQMTIDEKKKKKDNLPEFASTIVLEPLCSGQSPHICDHTLLFLS